MKEAFLISVILILVGGVATLLVTGNATSLKLDSAELVDTLIQIWLAVAAFVSAAFVVTSYIQTNRAFQLSQKPQLLIQVHNQVQEPAEGPEKGERFHVTALSYRNLSPNQFEDLTIGLEVTAGDVHIGLEELFTPEMFMAAGDSRTRRFRTFEELDQRGFDMRAAVESGDEVLLRTGYQFEFMGKPQRVEVQDYRWDVVRNEWQLR